MANIKAEFLEQMLKDGYVYLDDASWPYFVFKSTLYYWCGDSKKWVSLRKLAYGEFYRLKPRALSNKDAKLYHELHISSMLVLGD